MLQELSDKTGKSKKVLLFEFMRDEHPITFKRWMANEELKRTGKMTGDGCETYISLINGEFIENKVIS